MPLIHLSEWPKSVTLTISNAGEDSEQQELNLTLLTRMKTNIAT